LKSVKLAGAAGFLVAVLLTVGLSGGEGGFRSAAPGGGCA